MIDYLCNKCSELLELDGFHTVNEVGRKRCGKCGDNGDNLVVVDSWKLECRMDSLKVKEKKNNLEEYEREQAKKRLLKQLQLDGFTGDRMKDAKEDFVTVEEAAKLLNCTIEDVFEQCMASKFDAFITRESVNRALFDLEEHVREMQGWILSRFGESPSWTNCDSPDSIRVWYGDKSNRRLRIDFDKDSTVSLAVIEEYDDFKDETIVYSCDKVGKMDFYTAFTILRKDYEEEC